MKIRGFHWVFFLTVFTLTSSCYKNEPVPNAGFIFIGDNEYKAPCNLTFTNTSTNAFSFDWQFGDGTTSVEKNPRHTYNKPGKYIIKLRSYTQSRNEWASAENTVSIAGTVD
jgi:hypothetical protein